MSVLHRVAARLIHYTTALDRAYRLADRARSKVVVAAASDKLLDAYNDLAYGRTSTYRADAKDFRRSLFRWEQEALVTYFPSPPARVLIGGAGGGREALALAERGYHVTAFEPSIRLARSMAAAASAEGRDVRTFVARYEDLPHLTSCDTDAPPIGLDSLGSFDAGVLGWTSYSHIRSEARREEALRAMAAACRGPVLLSFFPATSEGRDAFSTSIGFYHRSDETEIRRAADRAGLHVWYLTMEDMDGRWPYAVVARSPRPTL